MNVHSFLGYTVHFTRLLTLSLHRSWWSRSWIAQFWRQSWTNIRPVIYVGCDDVYDLRTVLVLVEGTQDQNQRYRSFQRQ
jgi:hypothetical protein